MKKATILCFIAMICSCENAPIQNGEADLARVVGLPDVETQPDLSIIDAQILEDILLDRNLE